MHKKSKFALVAAGLGSAAIASAGTTVVTNTDPANLPVLPDNGCVDDTAGTGLGGISRTIAFTENGTINDINVTLEMTQTWRSDIQVGLSYTGGGGNVVLANNWDTSGDNLFAQVNSESANGLCSLPANCGTSGVTGCSAAPGPECQPNQPLTAFNGLATPGTFTLTVCDRATGDLGDLVSWSVTADIDTVAADVAPVMAYTPPPGSTINFSGGGGAIGTIGNGSIDVAVGTPGTGAAATTVSCTPPTAPFAGFDQVVTATGPSAATGGPLSGTCVLGAAPVNQTLTCVENQNGNQVTLTFELSCPAGGAAPAPAAVLSVFGDNFQKWLVMALLALGLVTLSRRFIRR